MNLTLSSALAIATAGPALADYPTAKANFERLSREQQAAVTLGLVATGDFDGLFDFGFTRRLYGAIREFESREHLQADGILEPREMERLQMQSQSFYQDLDSKFYPHPTVEAKLLVPRKLFDQERREGTDVVFTRDDRNLSLNFTAFPVSERSFADLYAAMVAPTPDRVVTYTRLFRSHFVVTGTFRGHLFYSWFNRLPDASVGFTLSWSKSWDQQGRKLSALLANTLQVE